MALSKSLLSNFANPPAQFRGKPFWAWNGKLEESELRRQIRIMKKMGFGGFFMHSRVGLDTPYLGKEWFKSVEACIDEAKKNNMEAWLYDEDRWPSGAAGGLVTKNPAYRMRRLHVDIVEAGSKLLSDKDVLAIFTAQITENSIFVCNNKCNCICRLIIVQHHLIDIRRVVRYCFFYSFGTIFLTVMADQ